MSRVPGAFALVLHSHLPWLAHHGRWPVGEEWLYQSWAASYQPVFGVLRRLAADGLRDRLTLGVTPVLAAQLDDPHCLRGMHSWLADWQLRAREAAQTRVAGPGPASTAAARRALGGREHVASEAALADFERHWRHGGSAQLRELVGSGVVELLGGPLAHPFAPLLDPRLRRFSLVEGLYDAALRWGVPERGRGIWAPECAFAPGMETEYDAAGVTHFLVDGPSLRGDTALGRPVRDADVVAFGRDLTVSYRVWSPRSGYPGHADYRDFHTYDHELGLKAARVTGKKVASGDKAPYDPDRARRALAGHVDDFVTTVVDRLRTESARIGRDALVVAAFDTELFGHWWHEGPEWLEAVLRALPEAGVRVTTLAGARADGYIGEPVELRESSWGSGKDWRVWEGPQVADLVRLNAEMAAEALRAVDERLGAEPGGRDRVADQIVREALLGIASDWAFMVSKDTAAGYARDRAHKHRHALFEIAAAGGDTQRRLAAAWGRADSPFPQLDARRLAAAVPTGGGA